MSEFISPQHALSAFMDSHINPADSSVSVRLLNNRSFINIRGSSDDQEFMAAVEEVLGCALPIAPNAISVALNGIVLWLSPDEWLLCESNAESVQQALREALINTNCAINSQTGGLVGLQISGPMAQETLCKGCTLDLSALVANEKNCAQTNLSHAGVIMRFVGENDGFELIVRRSFTEYVALWLQKAGHEYGIRFDVLPDQS